MRPSSIANRTSYAPGLTSQVNAPATLAKLSEKKKEYEGVAALERASNAFLQRIEGLEKDCDVMAVAAEVHGQVLDQWPKMFHILSLYLASRESSADQQPDTEHSEQGQMLVRIPIEDLKHDTTPSSTD